ncbi:MAG: ATP-binding protein [Proteobacteria bacterium]|nr:ATP-binding protein [Burkholderiales bacterium]
MPVTGSEGLRSASDPRHQPGFNPFPGLRPFQEHEEYLYFGREPQADALITRLAATHFLAVVGTSGSGKSSLVNCGLRPALHRGLMTSAGSAWRMAYLRPGLAPLTSLAEALAAPNVLFSSVDTGEFSQAELIESSLRVSKLGLIDAFTQARLPAHTNLLIVVDQFEELFRYRALASAGRVDEARVREDATAFMNLLLEVPEHPNLPIFVVLTMRSDFLGDCAQFFGLPEAINRGQYLVPRMTREERRTAISGPIGVGGAEIDPVLLTRLVNDVGDNPDQLSQLQHAMNRTWAGWRDECERDAGTAVPISLRHYEAIGTIAQALNQHAEEAFDALPTIRAQMLCEALFRAITDRRLDARGTRRPTRLDTLCAITEADADTLIEVIDVFRDPRCAFLMPPAGEPIDADTVIDISHESLMRVWTRLRQWGEEEALSARVLRRLAKTAELNAAGQANLLRNPELQVALDWRRQEKPNEAWASRYHPVLDDALKLIDASQAMVEHEEAEDARRRAEEAHLRAEIAHSGRRRRFWMGATTLFILVVTIGSYFVYLQQKAISAERAAFESEKTALAAKIAFEAERSRVRILDAESRDAQNQLAAAYQAAPNLVKGVSGAPATATVVYLQVPAGQNRAEAQSVQKQLQGAGYKAPGVEGVSVSPRNFELRYFREEDENSARKVAELVRRWTSSDLRLVRVPGFETRSRLQQFELWFPAQDAAAPARTRN